MWKQTDICYIQCKCRHGIQCNFILKNKLLLLSSAPSHTQRKIFNFLIFDSETKTTTRNTTGTRLKRQPLFRTEKTKEKNSGLIQNSVCIRLTVKVSTEKTHQQGVLRRRIQRQKSKNYTDHSFVATPRIPTLFYLDHHLPLFLQYFIYFYTRSEGVTPAQDLIILKKG